MFQTLHDAVVLFDFELMPNSLVNSYCHIETLTPFYGTFARKSDAMTSEQCFKYNHPSKPLRLIRMDGLILKKLFLVRLRSERLTIHKMVSK